MIPKIKNLTVMLLTLLSVGTAADPGIFNHGDRLVFMGDATSEIKDAKQIVYPNVMREMLKTIGVDVVVVSAGVRGDNSTKMLARMTSDVIALKPQWMFLLCGSEDVLGVPLDKYKQNIDAMVKLCQTNNIKVFLLSPLIPRDNGGLANKLEPYVEFLNEYAKARQIPLADLNAWSKNAAKRFPNMRGNRWTVDGSSPSKLSHIEMAKSILTGAGYDTNLMVEAVDSIMRNVNNGPTISAQFQVSCADYLDLLKEAKARKSSVNEVFAQKCRSLIK